MGDGFVFSDSFSHLTRSFTFRLWVESLLVGMWQTSSSAWGDYPPASSQLLEMKRYLDAGFTTFDMADHYGNAEPLYGQFQKSISSTEIRPIGCTKWCPQPGKMPSSVVQKAIQERCSRMQLASLDLLQFHWWDYEMRREMWDAIRAMDELRKSGVIKNLGLTNFDTKHMVEFIEAGIPIVSNQVTRSVTRFSFTRLQTPSNLVTYRFLSQGPILPHRPPPYHPHDLRLRKTQRETAHIRNPLRRFPLQHFPQRTGPLQKTPTNDAFAKEIQADD